MIRFVKIRLVSRGEPRTAWVPVNRIVSIMEPPAPGIPGGIVLEGGGIFDIGTQQEINELLDSIVRAQEVK